MSKLTAGLESFRERVIGGRVRDEFPFSAYLFYKHGGGGGFGGDVRDDEYGEVLDPKAIEANIFVCLHLEIA